MSLSVVGNLNVNTGAINGDTRRGRIVMVLIGDAQMATSDYVDTPTADTFLLTKVKLPRLSANKLFPLPIVQGTNSKTVAAKEASLGYGLNFKLLPSRPGYEFDVVCGIAQEKQLMKFDGGTYPVRLLDHKRIFWGSADSAGNQNGISCLVSVEPGEFEDGQNVKPTKVQIAFIDSADGSINLLGIPTNLLNSDLKGLNDVTLSEKSAHAANVFKLQAIAKTAVAGLQVNLASKFGATLAQASAVTFFVATNVQTGAAVSITSTALNTAGDGYDVTLDSTAFTAMSTGDKIDINLAAPSVLDAAGITEVEGIKVRVTK